jgi:small subunit ribosomal protein S4
MPRSSEKRERALGIKLFLKGDRCNSPKCAMVRRPNRPGMHGGKRRRALSEYGEQLLEKQRIKASYGLREAQLTKIVKEAMKERGAASDLIVNQLERQLSNVIFRLSLTSSRIIARQLIGHGHFLVNGKKVAIPSYAVKAGDVISIKPSSSNLLIFKDLSNKIKKYEPPEWLYLDKEKLEGKVLSLPKDIEMPFDVSLVVDYYSK